MDLKENPNEIYTAYKLYFNCFQVKNTKIKWSEVKFSKVKTLV